MAILDYNDYVARLTINRAADWLMNFAFARTGRMSAAWVRFSPIPPIRTTSVALDKDSDESINPIPTVSTGRLTFLGIRLNTSTGLGGGIFLVDLLNGSGGLSAILTTEQTTNLPTAALTRHTSGEGVMVGILPYVNLGNTTTTVTVSYTNQSGVSSRISTPTTFGGVNFNTFGTLILIPLQAGDTGVRSVESLTIAGSTGVAGNFGVFLFKPLAAISLDNTTAATSSDAISSGGIINSFCEIHPNACLSVLGQGNQQIVNGSVILTEA
jgi:hypothetical protein